MPRLLANGIVKRIRQDPEEEEEVNTAIHSAIEAKLFELADF